MKQFWFSIVSRSIYLLLLISSAMQHGWSTLPQNLIVFFALLVVWIPAVKDKRFFTYDALFVLLFASTVLLELVGVPLVSSVLGIDKIFHFGAGVAIGLVLVAILPGKITIARFTTLIMLACVIGSGWEVFEWIEFLFRPQMALTLIDTYLDLVADVLGAAVVFAYTARR